MFISPTELERRLKSENNLTNKLRVRNENDLKRVNRPRLPNTAIRAVVGSLAEQGVPPKDISQAFGVSKNQIKSAEITKVPDVASAREKTVEKVREMALDRMLVSLGLMDNTKLENCTAKDLSAVASNLSRVIDRTSQRDAGDRLQLIIYAPQQKEEKDYKVVDI